MLQVAMVGSNKIQIGGIFQSKLGVIDIAPQSDGTAVMNFNLNDTELESEHIPTLFKYPCLTNASNLGKMNSLFYPSSSPLTIPTLEFGLGIFFLAIGTIISYFAWDTYSYYRAKEREERDEKERKQKERERNQLGNLQRHGHGNSYYKKRRLKSA